jgi:hypothetical protein
MPRVGRHWDLITRNPERDPDVVSPVTVPVIGSPFVGNRRILMSSWGWEGDV